MFHILFKDFMRSLIFHRNVSHSVSFGVAMIPDFKVWYHGYPKASEGVVVNISTQIFAHFIDHSSGVLIPTRIHMMD